MRIDGAWELVERFAHLVRDSGGADEAKAVGFTTDRLRAWGNDHHLHHPEVLISIPGKASLSVGSRAYPAKTQSMAIRGGDVSFLNLGLSTLFMLSSNMSNETRKERGLYGVGGCGGNIEWHTEADTIEIADRKNLLRDMGLYAGVAFRAANLAVHPLDFRRTLVQISETLAGYREKLGERIDWRPLDRDLASAQSAVDGLYASSSDVASVEQARNRLRRALSDVTGAADRVAESQ